MVLYSVDSKKSLDNIRNKVTQHKTFESIWQTLIKMFLVDDRDKWIWANGS